MMLLLGLLGLMIASAEADPLAVFAATALGAFLAALPERIRHRKEPHLRSGWKGCLICFIAGLFMTLALGLAQVDQLAAGLMQGSVSAWVFGLIAWLAALGTSRLHERRRRA